MLNISPDRLPSRRPHRRRGFGNSPFAHMAVSMMMLAIAAGVAMYRIQQLNARRSFFSQDDRDQQRASRLETLAQHGNLQAQLELATVYANGMGVKQDPAEAARWNRVAAERGDSSGQIRLAQAYTFGTGVPRDFSQAAHWLKVAAEQGDAEAECSYGIYRFQGIGVEKDVVDGYKWLLRAAKGGSDSAQMSLTVARKQMSLAQLAAAGDQASPASP